MRFIHLKKNIYIIIVIIILLFLLFFSYFWYLDDIKKYSILDKKPKYGTFFSHDYLHDIEFIFSSEEWKEFSREVKKKDKKDLDYRRITFKYKSPFKKVTFKDVGIKIQGRSTFKSIVNNGKLRKIHFRLKFNEQFDLKKGTKEYKKRKDRRFCRLRGLVLKNRNYDISQIRDLYCYNLFNRVGVNTSKTGSARVTITIDNESHYFGIYTIIEPIDKSFLTKRFSKKDNDGNLYECGVRASLELNALENEKYIGLEDSVTGYIPLYELKTNEGKTDFSDLKDFIYNINKLEGEEFKKYIENNFEVDGFIKQMALNVLIGNPDSYRSNGHNYYLYFSKNKIEMFPYDFDMSLRGDWFFDDPDIYKWTNLDEVQTGIKYEHPLSDKILQIDEYREKYNEYLENFIIPEHNIFTYNNYKKSFKKFKSLYFSYLKNDIRKKEKMKNGPLVEEFIYKRTKSVVRQLGLNEENFEIRLDSKLFKLRLLLGKVERYINELRTKMGIRTRIRNMFKRKNES